MSQDRFAATLSAPAWFESPSYDAGTAETERSTRRAAWRT
jgi:hypothetical protein